MQLLKEKKGNKMTRKPPTPLEELQKTTYLLLKANDILTYRE